MNIVRKLPTYSAMVAGLTMLSLFSHLNPGSLLWLNYLGATGLFLTDLVMAARHEETFQRVFFLNIFIFGAWLTLSEELYTVWLILYTVKSYCVASLLFRCN